MPSNKKIKIISTTRLITDVPYSLYNHMQSQHDEAMNKFRVLPSMPKNFDQFFDLWLDMVLQPEWMAEQWRRRNDDNHLMLTFEELVRDKKGTSRRLIEFLGLPLMSDEELERDVLPKLTTTWMSAHQRDTILKVTL
jgi:hypothetical protein